MRECKLELACMSKGRYIKNASNNSDVRHRLSVHVIVEERLHIKTFGPKSPSADFIIIFLFFGDCERAYLLQINDGFELR
jgi:hypothetical protein